MLVLASVAVNSVAALAKPNPLLLGASDKDFISSRANSHFSNTGNIQGTGPYHPAVGVAGSPRIAFGSVRNGGNHDVFVMDLDGSNQTRLTTSPAYDDQPKWSPDSSKIAFISDRDGNFEIYTMNADGSAQTRITTNPAADGFPAWSNDGTKIAFVRGDLRNPSIRNLRYECRRQ